MKCINRRADRACSVIVDILMSTPKKLVEPSLYAKFEYYKRSHTHRFYQNFDRIPPAFQGDSHVSRL